ncbi:MAG: hypothetical protein ACLP7F_07200 [Acidimicrobiales bacterium]
MGTTQSAIARMEGGGARPMLEPSRSSPPSRASSWSASVSTCPTIAASPSSSATATPSSAARVDRERRVRGRWRRRGLGPSFLYFFLQLQPGVEKGVDVDVGFQEALADQ